MADNGQGRERRPARGSWSYWLLLLPLIFMMWVPSYNRAEPSLAGFPFFYWYLLLWVFIGAGITALVYFLTEREER
jgi:Protein of unknown function (DUF3311)